MLDLSYLGIMDTNFDNCSGAPDLYTLLPYAARPLPGGGFGNTDSNQAYVICVYVFFSEAAQFAFITSFRQLSIAACVDTGSLLPVKVDYSRKLYDPFQ